MQASGVCRTWTDRDRMQRQWLVSEARGVQVGLGMLHSARRTRLGTLLITRGCDRTQTLTGKTPLFHHHHHKRRPHFTPPSLLPRPRQVAEQRHDTTSTSSPTDTSLSRPSRLLSYLTPVASPTTCLALLLRAVPARSPSTSASSMTSRMSSARAHTVLCVRRCTSLPDRRLLSRKSYRLTSNLLLPSIL